MNIVIDPALAEEVVLRQASRGEETNDLSYRQYRRRADLIYSFYKPEEREIQFQRLHRNLFFKWGFVKLITDALNEFDKLIDVIESMVVKKALSKSEEEADLFEGGGRPSPLNRAISLKLLADRFEDQNSLHKFLRHELMHISDMLDEKFEYTLRRLADSPMEENIIRDRYRILWDIYIDARLERSKKESTSTRDQRYSEFGSLYRKLSPIQVKAAFDTLWESKDLSHDDLLRMAKDITELLKRTSQVPNSALRPSPSAFQILPGSPCPLCRFPSYYWAEEIIRFPKVIESIKEDFPRWRPEDGCCERCAERYSYQLSAVSDQLKIKNKKTES